MERERKNPFVDDVRDLIRKEITPEFNDVKKRLKSIEDKMATKDDIAALVSSLKNTPK